MTAQGCYFRDFPLDNKKTRDEDSFMQSFRSHDFLHITYEQEQLGVIDFGKEQLGSQVQLRKNFLFVVSTNDFANHSDNCLLREQKETVSSRDEDGLVG